jgi:hypothetical protein
LKATQTFEYPIANTEYPMKKEREFDLQDRLVDYAVRIMKKKSKEQSRPGLGYWTFLAGYWIFKRGKRTAFGQRK